MNFTKKCVAALSMFMIVSTPQAILPSISNSTLVELTASIVVVAIIKKLNQTSIKEKSQAPLENVLRGNFDNSRQVNH